MNTARRPVGFRNNLTFFLKKKKLDFSLYNSIDDIFINIHMYRI
jgi:hypothetical protein